MLQSEIMKSVDNANATELKVVGRYKARIIRDGVVIDEFEGNNLVVNEGLDHILNSTFHGASQVTTWYIGVFEGNYTPVAGDTAATFPASSTECTAYDEATRQEFVEAAASGGSITNTASRATFTFNATKTIYGCFISSASAKSSTLGTLMSAFKFASAKSVVATDTLDIDYTLTIAAA